MFAIIAAILFALALLLDLAEASLGDTISTGTLVTAGLLCVALHLAGVGVGARTWGWRRRVRR
jgi:hypothetical protein